MPRADELESGDRTRLPQWGIVEVEARHDRLTRTAIDFKTAIGGHRGRVWVAPHAEMEDCT
jgi:hypothetical protein